MAIQPRISCLSVDTFFVFWGFSYIPLKPNEGVSQVVADAGNVFSYRKWTKDNFTLKFLCLTEYQYIQLKNIYNTVGVNGSVYHKIIYDTPAISRIWDGATAMSAIVNPDCATRQSTVRNKCLLSNWMDLNLDGNPNFRAVSFDCMET